MHFGERIKRARKAKRLSQEDIVRLSRERGNPVSRHTLIAWEMGRVEGGHTPKLRTVAEILDLSLDDLLRAEPLDSERPPRTAAELLERLAIEQQAIYTLVHGFAVDVARQEARRLLREVIETLMAEVEKESPLLADRLERAYQQMALDVFAEGSRRQALQDARRRDLERGQEQSG